MSIAHLLPNAATVYRPANSLSEGAVLTAEALVAAGVKCRLTSPRSRSLELYGGQETPRLTAVAYFEPSADVLTGDRVEIRGRSYRVIAAQVQSDDVYLHASLDPLA
jgi:hypothetical protein